MPSHGYATAWWAGVVISRRSKGSTVRITGAVAAGVTLAVLCTGGILLLAGGLRVAGVVVLVLVGVCALYVVPFILLVWLHRRGEKLLARRTSSLTEEAP